MPNVFDPSCSRSNPSLWRLFSAPWEVQLPATPASESLAACLSIRGFTGPEFSRANPFQGGAPARTAWMLRANFRERRTSEVRKFAQYSCFEPANRQFPFRRWIPQRHPLL